MKKSAALLAFILILLNASFAQGIQKLRVMTYNIHHGQGVDGKIDIERIGGLILENKAGLVALQEVDRGVERSGKIDIMQMLNTQTGMFMAFGKNIDFQGGDYGNGILSGFKIDTVKNHHYKMLREGETRGLLRSVADIGGQKVVFINTHTGDKNSESEKLMNAGEIIDVLKSCDGLPVILCGDFNDRPKSKMHDSLAQYFVDVWQLLHKDEGFSFPSTNPDRRIDYIYVSKEALRKLKPVSIKVLQSEASDHLPLLAEFELSEDK